jgi:hypothetical protein
MPSYKKLRKQMIQRRDAAKAEGAIAHEFGKDRRSNPHEPGSLEYDGWNFGWDFAARSPIGRKEVNRAEG